MSEVKHGVGLPSAKTSFKPTSQGKNTTLPLEKTALEAGEERYGLDPDIAPEKAHLNFFISQYGYTKGQEVIDHCKRRMEEISQVTGRKVREDAIPMIATILKPNAAVIMPMDQAGRKALLDDMTEEALVSIGYKALRVKSRKDCGNITREQALEKGKSLSILIAYHFDERVPHVHILWEPIEIREGVPHYNAKRIHDKGFLGSLNREIPQALIEKGYNFDKSFDFWDATEELRLERLREKAEGKIRSGQSSMEFKKGKLDEAKRELERMEELASEPLVEVPIEEKTGVFSRKTVIEVSEPKKLDDVIQQNKALKITLKVKEEEITIIKKKVQEQETELQELRPYKGVVKRIVDQIVYNPLFDILMLKTMVQEMPLFKLIKENAEKKKQQPNRSPEFKKDLKKHHGFEIEK